MNRKTVITEGIMAGLLGAAGVAVWFLIIDLVAGHPFYTPALLGQTTLSVLGRGIEQHSMMFNVGAYTALHVAAFIGVGLLASVLVYASERVPQLSAGLLLLFVVFEVGFYFLAALVSQRDLLGFLAWYQVGAANLVAAVLMGTYLWRRHPGLKGTLSHALDGSV